MPKKITQSDFLRRAAKVHGTLFDYSASVYTRALDLMQIGCVTHGPFFQIPNNHLQGAGCPKCAGRGVDWVARFRSVHGDLYDYSLVAYEDYKQSVRILCSKHGEFRQTPDNHYRGAQGCPQCKGGKLRKNKQMPIAEFVTRATVVHDGRYTYGPQQFSNLLTGVVTITCPKHGVFTQSPVNHLAGKVGCTKCNHMASKAEQVIAEYLKTFTTVVQRDRTVIKPKELDIYLPEKALAVEYSGMYWHSHSSQEDEKKNKHKHFQKYKECNDQGIRLLTIYETEWHERPQAIRRLLRNALGKSRGKLMARKCELRKVLTSEARVFYEKYHPQGGEGGGEHYGLYHGDKLVACMRFALGANDRGAGAKDRTWTLGRYATRVTVAGAASRLFKAFLAEVKPQEVKSFSDNRYFAGGMYSALGFTLEEDVAPDYQVWSQKLGLRPKSHYQRRQLPKRLGEHGVTDAFNPDTDPRTETEMTYLMGAQRIFDCGKKRWVYKTPCVLEKSVL